MLYLGRHLVPTLRSKTLWARFPAHNNSFPKHSHWARVKKELVHHLQFNLSKCTEQVKLRKQHGANVPGSNSTSL